MTNSSADKAAPGSEARLFATGSLEAVASAFVAAGYRVVAPVRQGDLTRLAPWQAGQTIDLDHFTVNSAKEFLLPATETIQRYDIDGNDFTPVEVAPDATKTVLLGIRPCDAAALTLMDTIFNWDFDDVFYNTRRQTCTVVPLVCTRADESCFCTSVGLSPDSARNADAMLMFTEGGKKLILSPLTEKGRELAASAGAVTQAAPDKAADVPVRFDVQAVTAWLAEAFDSPAWTELSAGCLSCGACAYACGSCHCFDIQDESAAGGAVRYRNWDACCIALFTKHTSGHNPRSAAQARWRQRVMHKFSYIPQRFNMLGCTGCGRCTRLCPAGMTVAETCERIDAICQSTPSPK